jgi:hypothetical protein
MAWLSRVELCGTAESSQLFSIHGRFLRSDKILSILLGDGVEPVDIC